MGAASKENPLALLRYQTLTQADYGPWRADYLAVQCDREYGKPFNCSSCASTLAAPNLEHVWAFSSESYDGWSPGALDFFVRRRND